MDILQVQGRVRWSMMDWFMCMGNRLVDLS